MTLSACLIVKDEAANLPRCLASLRGKVDEIVVVDTGSTDDSVAIAAAAGAKIGHFPWRDDFAAARNAAIDLATGDWVLIIDADEELGVDDPAALQALMAGPKGAYLVPLHDVDQGRQAGNVGQVVRLFPRHTELRFDGRIHESIGAGLTRLGWPLFETEALHLTHHGYRPEVMIARGKPERNLRLARLSAEERPDRPLSWFDLGRSAISANRLPEALAAWERLRAMPPSDPYQPQYLAVLEQLCKQLADDYVRHCKRLSGARLSACMIVKDEAANLPRCLASLEGLVDEIVVVDTGSTDDTVAIARAAGAKVGHFAWRDDFAAARNASLELATGDWILVIDADEELSVPDKLGLRAALQGQANAFLLEIQNLDEHGRVESRYPSAPRLFRRNPAVRFVGRLHEDVSKALAGMGWASQALPGVAIRHHGYVPALLEARNKVERNRRLAEAMTQEQPDDPDAWLHLAAINWHGRQAEAALKAAERAQALVTAGRPMTGPRQVNLVLIQAGALAALDRRDEALAALDRGLARRPGHPELHYDRGQLRLAAGDAAGARADFTAAVAAHGTKIDGVTRNGITSFLPRTELMGLALAEGRMEDVVAELHALTTDPACPPEEAARFRELMAQVEQLAAPATPALSGREAILAQLQENPRDPAAFLDLSFDCFEAGQLDRALVAVTRSLELYANATAFYLLGLIVAEMEQPGLAERCFATVLRLDPEHPRALEMRLMMRGRKPVLEADPGFVANLERLLALATPRLSACLIVKNEAEALPRCLEALQRWVDEIVVVDTGSTDDTVAIATAAGAKVGHFEWCDDFAAARNAALAMATGDWVLSVDADEELVVDDPDGLAAALRSRVAAGYNIVVANLNAAGERALDARMLRLFQRVDGMRWRGRLHETVDASIAELGWPTLALDGLHLRHSGYIPAVVAARQKPALYLRIAELEAQEAQAEPLAWYNLAIARVAAEDWAGARAAFDHLETLPGGLMGMVRARRAHGVIQRVALDHQQGRLADAEALLTRALELEPGFPEFLFERGRLRAAQGDAAGAIADFQACLVDPKPFADLPMRPGVTDALPQAALELARQLPIRRGGLRVAGSRRLDSLERTAAKPGAIPQRMEATASTALEQAFNAYRSGDHVAALAQILRSVELYTSHTAFTLLGMVMTSLRQPALADRSYAAVLQLDPENATALAERVRVRSMSPGPALAPEQLAVVERLLAMAVPRLTACLIVKNEEANLPRCLASLQGKVDEIVVVDTGSTDNTVAIAEAAGAKVGHFEWCDDFAAARNAALDLATGDWVLVIDADEELVVDDPQGLVEALRWRLSGSYITQLTNVGPEGETVSQAPVIRLFQRLPELRYEGRLHENISAGARRLGWRVMELQAIRFLHHGYQMATVEARAKGERNTRLAALDAQEHPDDVTAQVNLARSLALDGKQGEALEVYERVAARAGWTDALADADYVLYAFNFQDLLRHADRFAEADAVLTTALARLPGNPDLLFERGNVRFRLGQVDAARADFQACLEAKSTLTTLRAGVTDELPRLALAQLANGGKPLLSACLIVKDEAANLPRCLASLRGLADEIVVVDTGSSDNTVAIAKAAGAKIGHFAWTGSFGEARNASLELATGDWVLVIDADEELVVQDPAAFRDALKQEALGGYIFPIHNLKDDGSFQIQPMLRLFRRDERVRFAGRLHEEATRAIEALGWQVRPLPDVFLRHYGYLSAAIAGRDKWTRNFKIAIAEVEAHPESPLAWYNLGRSSLFTGQTSPAMAAFDQVARLLAEGHEMGEAPYCTYVLLRKRLLQEAGKTAEAEAILDAGLERVPGFPEFLYERGLLRCGRRDLAGAAADFKACLQPGTRLYTGAIRPEVQGRLAKEALAALEAERR